LNDFIEHLDIPRLTDEERDRVEGTITRQECKLALDTFQANKTPGEDGFKVEFYKYFVGLLGEDLVATFHACRVPSTAGTGCSVIGFARSTTMK